MTGPDLGQARIDLTERTAATRGEQDQERRRHGGGAQGSGGETGRPAANAPVGQPQHAPEGQHEGGQAGIDDTEAVAEGDRAERRRLDERQ